MSEPGRVLTRQEVEEIQRWAEQSSWNMSHVAALARSHEQLREALEKERDEAYRYPPTSDITLLRDDLRTMGYETFALSIDAFFQSAGRAYTLNGYELETARADRAEAGLAAAQEALKDALDGNLRHRRINYPTRTEGVVRIDCAEDCEACAALARGGGQQDTGQ